MAKYDNAKLVPRATPSDSGSLYIDRQITDLNASGFITANPASGDNIQIGVVPAGCKLVAHLSTIQVPVLDAHASASTVKYKIGSVAVPDALVAEKTPGNNATSLCITTDFKVGATGFGSATVDTPIYLNLSAAVATQPNPRGKVVFDLAIRAWDSKFDV